MVYLPYCRKCQTKVLLTDLVKDGSDNWIHGVCGKQVRELPPKHKSKEAPKAELG